MCYVSLITMQKQQEKQSSVYNKGKRKGEAEGGRKRPRIELNPQIQAPVDEPHCAQKNREKRHSGQQPPRLDF